MFFDAKNTCHLMEKIAQLVERCLITEVPGSRPGLFFFVKGVAMKLRNVDPTEFSEMYNNSFEPSKR